MAYKTICDLLAPMRPSFHGFSESRQLQEASGNKSSFVTVDLDGNICIVIVQMIGYLLLCELSFTEKSERIFGPNDRPEG